MIATYKKTSIKWAMAALTTTLVAGCSGLNNPTNPINSVIPSSISQNQGTSATSSQQNINPNTPTTSSSPANSIVYKNTQTKATDPSTFMLLNMMQLARQGKVINCAFPILNTVKCGLAVGTNIEAVEKSWGKADKTDYVASANGLYATYTSHDIVFGINKGEQIFEVRSFDDQLKGLSLAKVKEVFGAPAYDHKSNNQEIIGYEAGSQFKIEMVFPKPTSANPNPLMDHYNVLYPKGTVNPMADDPGRQW